jgi:NADH-quinone oxidoreductase subunit M
MLPNFANLPLISTLIALPLITALLLVLWRAPDAKTTPHKWLALMTSLVVFVLSLPLYIQFAPSFQGFQFLESHSWFPSLGLTYRVGIDGISVFFVLLSTLLVPICLMASWHSITSRVRTYLAMFMLLLSFMVGMFTALDTILFYVFFEALLIPMFLLIGIWGGQRRVYAAFKFFLYTLLGSVLMLVALIAIAHYTGTTDMTVLTVRPLPKFLQHYVWWAFFISFAVKVPMWPVHTWLPDAHVEAPTAGSVILAGVLLKMGGYGFLRFSMPMAPLASFDYAPLMMALSVVAVIYTSLVALVQTDMKKLIAYSSVAHMGYVTLGLFSITKQGVDGALIQMISHGFVSAALFLCVGVLYDRLHTRDMARYGGVVQAMPKFATIMMLFTMASVGLPATSGFVGEFLVLLGTFARNTWFATLAATGLILGAAYMLKLYRAVIFGQVVHDDVKKLPDISGREFLMFAPLIALTLFIGIYPTPIFKTINTSVNLVLDTMAAAQIIDQSMSLQKALGAMTP